jgi:CheY-like chemotaxis protein
MQIEHPERRLVLIAERDHNVRELQQYFLEEAGFAVEFVDDGEYEFERAKEIHPAVIVTEIMIPVLDGLALCRRLREDPATANIPVIVFTILAASARASEAGAKAFLRKPFVESVFLDAIRDAIGPQPSGIKEKQWASH